jgi:hypothetical protein
MVQNQQVTIFTARSHEFDRTVGGSQHPGADRRGVVDATVGAPYAYDREITREKAFFRLVPSSLK